MNLFNDNTKLSTYVTFPSGSISEETQVLLPPWVINEHQSAIFTEKTPFHPLDYKWPDQPADRGWMHIAGKIVVVRNCLVVGRHENKMYLGDDIPVGKGQEGWEFLVAHIVETQDIHAIQVLPHSKVSLQVNALFRHAISRAHTAAHLMSLALNKAIAPYWKKITNTDGLASPDFDKIAIEKASITAHRSEDTYRLGKSIRKKGLNVEAVLENLSLIEKNINDFLSEILSKKPTISVTPPVSFLHARREWSCRWNDTCVTIPCGGTHLLDEAVTNIQVNLASIGNNALIVKTSVFLRAEEKIGFKDSEFI